MIASLLATTHAGAHAASNSITVPSIRWLAILPPIIMIGGAVVLLGLASLVRQPLRVRVSTIATVIISGGALGVALWQWSDVQQHGAHTYIKQAVVMDGFSVLITMLVAIAMLLTALVADGYLRREGMHGAEFHVLAMVSASGAMLMGMANDLIIIFLGLEILSIAPLRAHRLQLQARRIRRGGPQVLHPRRLLLGHLRLRHCARPTGPPGRRT